MRKFTEHIVIAGSIRLPVDMIVGLTTLEQYRKRAAKLELSGDDDFYKVIKPVGFKQGEKLLLDPSFKFNPKQIAEVRPEEPEEVKDASVKPEGDVLIRAIRDEIFNLTDEEYTGDDMPKVDALSERLGYKVTSAERDAGTAAHSEYLGQLSQTIEMITEEMEEGEIPMAEKVAEYFTDETISQELVDAIYKSLK